MKAPERRRQLVGAARAVLGRNGVAGTTLRQVASEAQVPLGTVSYIFATKEQLLQAVLEDVIEEIGTAVHGSAGSETDLGDVFRTSVLHVWSVLVEGRRGQQIMQYELTLWALRTPGMESLARRQYEMYLAVLAGSWANAADRLGVHLATPADQLARLFLAGLDGLILQRLALRRPEDSRHDVEALVTQMVRAATEGATR
jgi:AcrR family transcriptional regulator